jgi:IclR family pca regulon transcriptional regulator
MESVVLDFPRSEYVQSLQRGLAVIRAFDEEHPRRTLAEVAEATGLTRAAARRFILTLSALGYIQGDGRYYHLLPKTLQLGYAYLASLPWWRHAQRVSERLAIRMKSPCAVAVLDRNAIAYVAYAPPVSMPNVTRSIGTRQPAYATAIGRILLASLSDRDLKSYFGKTSPLSMTPYTVTDMGKLKAEIETVKQVGYAMIDQELELGLFSVGVAIRDRAGRVVAGLSISSGTSWSKHHNFMQNVIGPLVDASHEITEGSPN